MKYRILLVLSVLFFSFTTMAQKNWEEYAVENVSIKAPEGWKATKSENLSGGAYTITLKKSNTECFVEVTCLKKIMTPNTRMQDIATMRSQQANFEYMQIDKTESTKFQKNNARLLSYTNTYRNDVCKGGIYCFNAEGYTYAIEYFGEDNPETRKLLEKIVNTFKYSSPDKERNIVEQEKDYVEEDWHLSTETKDSIANVEAEKLQKQAEKEAKKEEKKLEKESKKSQEKVEKEEKADKKEKAEKKEKVEKKEKAEKEAKKAEKEAEKIKKEKEKAEKEAEKAEKERKKAEKKLKEEKEAKEKAEKKAEKERKAKEKAEKERAKAEKEKQDMVNDYNDVKKAIAKLEREQTKLTEEFVKAQNKNDVKKTEKISAKLQSISEKRVKLDEKLQKAEAKLKKAKIKY